MTEFESKLATKKEAAILALLRARSVEEAARRPRSRHERSTAG